MLQCKLPMSSLELCVARVAINAKDFVIPRVIALLLPAKGSFWTRKSPPPKPPPKGKPPPNMAALCVCSSHCRQVQTAGPSLGPPDAALEGFQLLLQHAASGLNNLVIITSSETTAIQYTFHTRVVEA